MHHHAMPTTTASLPRTSSSDPEITPEGVAATPLKPPLPWTAKFKRLAFGRKNREASATSGPTEENLHENNLRQAVMEEKNSRCSPYYMCLTDSSLVIHRRARSVTTGGSPGRESHATSVRSSSSSITSFVVKMKEWGSCFSYGNLKNKKEADVNPTETTAPATVSTTTTLPKEMGIIDDKSNAALATVVERSSDDLSAVDNGNPMNMTATAAAATVLRTYVGASDNKSATTAVAAGVNHEKPLRESVTPPEQRSPDSNPIGGSWCMKPAAVSSPEMMPAVAVSEPLPPDISLNGLAVVVEKEAEREKATGDGEFMWATKYRPKALEDFICNRDKALMLQRMIRTGDCGHFIFEGHPGVGKETMIRAMLREVFGPDNIQTQSETRVFDLNGQPRGSIEVVIKESCHHVEVKVSEMKGYEKHVIVELIKETHLRLSKKAPHIPENCRAMILHEADKLSTDALLYIKWLLERYKHTKVFFCCTDGSKLQPIKMLCTVIHLLPPSKEEVVKVLEFIAEQEGINMPRKLAERIADRSKNNLRQAIRSFEASCHKSYPFTEDQEIMTGWEDVIAMIAKKITEEQSPKQLFIIRGKLRTLMEHDVSGDFIFESLVQELKKLLDESLQNQVNRLYRDYNENGGEMFEGDGPAVRFASAREEVEMSKRSNDPATRNLRCFMRIEEFVARFMSCYKSSIRNGNNDSTTHQIGTSY